LFYYYTFNKFSSSSILFSKYHFRFIFGCNQWLPNDSKSRRLEVVLPVYGKEDVLSFKNLFHYNIFEGLTENHICLSIFDRPTSSNFTRVQRATCLFVFIIMTMVSNAIYFKPTDKYEDPEQTKIGPLILSFQTVYVSLVSSIVSSGTVLFVSILFRKSKPGRTQKCTKPKPKHAYPDVRNCFDHFFNECKELEKILISKGMIYTDGLILPFWCTFVAWFLSICGSTVAMSVLMLYSMEWGKQTTEMWLSQFVMSFGETTIVLDQIKVCSFIHYYKLVKSNFIDIIIIYSIFRSY